MQEIAKKKAEIHDIVSKFRKNGDNITLVPTMGYLHEGHMALIKRAKEEGGRVIVSIFVNPTQFGPREDFSNYPRNSERDISILKNAGVDAVFMPEVSEIYNRDTETLVDVKKLSRILIGRIRPGHFRGVATIVTKLFNIIQPDVACFGEKDYQQLIIIRKIVKDLDIPVKIISVPTQRDEDGLALSSRNVRLNPEDRKAATILSKSLSLAEEKIKDGVIRTAASMQAFITEQISKEPRASIKSVDVRNNETLASVPGIISKPVVILLAVKFGDILLIDQRVVFPKGKK